jgi:hypothetical protein
VRDRVRFAQLFFPKVTWTAHWPATSASTVMCPACMARATQAIKEKSMSSGTASFTRCCGSCRVADLMDLRWLALAEALTHH